MDCLEALTHRVRNSHPEEVKHERPSLLHKVIPLNLPLETLQKVIDADKEILWKSWSWNGKTPLSVACKSMAPLEVVPVQLILQESLGHTELLPG